MTSAITETPVADQKFVRGLGLLDSTMLVAGSMIGSGIFIVSADIARLVGSAGWLLAVRAVTGVLTVVAALSYGELAAMMPRAGGQYVYLREAYSPLWGFLYGWTLFLVIQTGTIAAVAVAFARFLGVFTDAVSPTQWIVSPIMLSQRYAVSLSTQQLVAILIIILLTFVNTRGLELGKLIQNVFTSAKTLSLMALIALGIFVGRNADALHANFTNFWTPTAVSPITSDLPFVGAGSGIMAVAIMVSTFGCCNGLILAGARVYYAMAQDGLFFKATARLNSKHVPATALVMQGIWTAVLVLPRTRNVDATTGAVNYGNLYSNLLDYIIFAALIFYVLTIAGIFVLRRKRPDAERPYRALGYPILPALYMVGATTIMLVLLTYRAQTTWPGLVIVLTGVPFYFLWKFFGKKSTLA